MRIYWYITVPDVKRLAKERFQTIDDEDANRVLEDHVVAIQSAMQEAAEQVLIDKLGW